MIEEGEYIYSIIQEKRDRRFGSVGVNNREIRLIHYKDIAAVVSSSPNISFDRFSKEDLTTHVVAHQKVNELLMKDYDVLPMAFGMIAKNEDETLRILEKVYFQLKTALQKIAGKTEFAVQIFLDEKKILEDLINNNSEIRKLKEESQSPLQGIAAKLKLGKLVFETLEHKKNEYLKDIEDFLMECSLDCKPGKLLDKAMIGNISFFIEKRAEPEFDQKLHELGQKYGEVLRFKYIGPMPPHSFVTVNFSPGNFEVINEARKLLGLPEQASWEEIKKAYYILCHQYHPDKFQGDQELIKKIIRAYGILENYCQSCDQVFGGLENQQYSFKEEDVKKSVMIK